MIFWTHVYMYVVFVNQRENVECTTKTQKRAAFACIDPRSLRWKTEDATGALDLPRSGVYRIRQGMAVLIPSGNQTLPWKILHKWSYNWWILTVTSSTIGGLSIIIITSCLLAGKPLNFWVAYRQSTRQLTCDCHYLHVQDAAKRNWLFPNMFPFYSYYPLVI